MTTKSAPYYWLVCTSCGAEQGDFDDYSAWPSPEDATERAESDLDWTVSGDKHHCPKCPPFCVECGEDAGELAGERDYHCESCWAAVEAS
jgi:hypothetical protein